MGLRQSSPIDDAGAAAETSQDPSRPSEEDLTQFPALARAFKIVSPDPISCFSDFWQVSLSDLTSSLTSYDAESMSALLEGLCEQIVVNTAYSDNLRSLIVVLCMSLEQYPQVLLHQQALAAASVPAQEAGRGSLVPPSAYLQAEDAPKKPPPEKVHELFQRLYEIRPLTAPRPVEIRNDHHTHSMYPISSIESMSTLPTPEWLLNLTFFARLFLQYICQLEYGDRKKQLLSLRPIKWMIEQEIAHKHAHPHKPFQLPPSSLHQDLSYRLTHTLMSAMADMPLTPATHELHSEMAGLFLALCSTQVYLPLSPLYAEDNLFLSHALQGPIRRRAKVIMNKWMRNIVQCTRRAKRQDLSSEDGASSSPPTVSESSTRVNDSSSIAVRISDPSSPSSISPTLSTTSPTPSPSPSPPTAEVRSLLPHPASEATNLPKPPAMSLRAKLTQLVGMAAQQNVTHDMISSGNQPHPSLLKRLGSRLFAILFFPMKLYHYFFDQLSQSGENDFARSLMLDPLSIRSTLCVLLMQHQNLDSFHTPAGTVIEDASGATRTITYVHEGERIFDPKRWSDESVFEDVESEHLHVASSSSAASSRSSSPSPPANVNPYRHVLASMMDADDAEQDEDDQPTGAASTSRSGGLPEHHQVHHQSAVLQAPSAVSRHNFTVSYPSLYEIFVSSSTNEFSTLLLYSLLHSSPSFRNYLLVKSDIDRLILPWLELLYLHAEGGNDSNAPSTAPTDSGDTSSASGLARVAAKKQQLMTQKFLGVALNINPGEKPTDALSRPGLHLEDVSDSVRNNRIYMLLIILLMLSSDKSFVQNAHTRLILNRVPFYSEARLNHISLGSVIILVFIKLIQCNLFQQRDHYVHTNACAILSNAAHGFPSDYGALDRASSQADVSSRSPSPRPGEPGSAFGMKLHPNVCLKLISLLTVLSKRYVKLMKKQQHHQAAHTSSQVVGINLARPTPSIHTSFQSISHPSSPDDVSLSTSSPDPTKLDELSTFSSFIRLIFDILLSALRGRNLYANTYLLYSLMQSVDILAPFKNDPLFWNHGGAELQSLCRDFSVRLEEAMKNLYVQKQQATTVTPTTSGVPPAVDASAVPHAEAAHPSAMSHMMSSLSIDDILGILKQQVKHHLPAMTLPSSASDETRTNHFTYIEQERSEEFFIPYLWNLIYHVGDILPFNEPMIVLFETKAEEESKKESNNAAAASSNSSGSGGKSRQNSSMLPSTDDTDVEGESVDDRENRRLATELEQIHFEHKLQQQVGAPTLEPKPATHPPASMSSATHHLFGPASGVALSAANSWISQNSTAPLEFTPEPTRTQH